MPSQKIAFETVSAVYKRRIDGKNAASAIVDFKTALTALSQGGRAFGSEVKTLPRRYRAPLSLAMGEK